MKRELLEISKKLDLIAIAYDGLQVISHGNCGDAGHVGQVLYVLNEGLRDAIKELDEVREGKPKLKIIDNQR